MSAKSDSHGYPGARQVAAIGRFLEWWWRSLVLCLPMSWRKALGVAHDRLLLSVVDGTWLIRVQDDEGIHVLAEGLPLPTQESLEAQAGVSRSRLPRWLLMPPAGGLRRRLLLPAVAANHLRDVAGYEIDRQTPFLPDDVFHDARVLGTRGDGQLEAELVVVPREHVETLLKELGGMANELAGIDLAGADGTPAGVNLLPVGRRRRASNPTLLPNLILAALALLFLVLAAGRILDNRRAAADALAADVDSRAGQARLVAADRQRLLDVVEGSLFLEQQRDERPLTVEVIGELTRRLPDGTYLEKLSIEGDRLMLIGLSSEASGLVAKLEGAPLWRSPALAGTVQPDPGSKRDRFTLVAELTGHAAVDAGEGSDASIGR